MIVAWADRLSTILVVDDDEGSRLVLRAVLEPSGHLVIEVPDGQAALDLISSVITPDIVVTDLSMPVLGGEALISRLRAEPKTNSIPIVVVSSDYDLALALQMSGHVDAFVAKPVDKGELAQTIGALGRSAWMSERAGMGAD
jgi:CheY-like chemotaxis protein